MFSIGSLSHPVARSARHTWVGESGSKEQYELRPTSKRERSPPPCPPTLGDLSTTSPQNWGLGAEGSALEDRPVKFGTNPMGKSLLIKKRAGGGEQKSLIAERQHQLEDWAVKMWYLWAYTGASKKIGECNVWLRVGDRSLAPIPHSA